MSASANNEDSGSGIDLDNYEAPDDYQDLSSETRVGLYELLTYLQTHSGATLRSGLKFSCLPPMRRPMTSYADAYPNGMPMSFELGFPTSPVEEWKRYERDGSQDWTQTVYGYVPVEVVLWTIAKNGGLDMDQPKKTEFRFNLVRLLLRKCQGMHQATCNSENAFFRGVKDGKDVFLCSDCNQGSPPPTSSHCGHKRAQFRGVKNGKAVFICEECNQDSPVFPVSRLCAPCGKQGAKHRGEADGKPVFLCDNCHRGAPTGGLEVIEPLNSSDVGSTVVLRVSRVYSTRPLNVVDPFDSSDVGSTVGFQSSW
jgi:hypothetical protein